MFLVVHYGKVLHLSFVTDFTRHQKGISVAGGADVPSERAYHLDGNRS